MIELNYDIAFKIDDIKREYKKSTVLEEAKEVYDSFGNPVHAFFKRYKTILIVTLIHNGERVDFKELNYDLVERCKELPFKTPLMGYDVSDDILDSCILKFEGEAYSVEQFQLICEEIVKFLRKWFYVVFEINNE